MTSLTRRDIIQSARHLSDDDVDGLVGFSEDCTRLLGSRLRSISLGGEPGAPVISVVFCDDRQRPDVLYSYEWRLRDLDEPDDITPLGVLLVDYLGTNIQEDLQTTPGLPMWEPDAQRVVHVDVRSVGTGRGRWSGARWDGPGAMEPGTFGAPTPCPTEVLTVASGPSPR
jgi:hypothetical protein